MRNVTQEAHNRQRMLRYCAEHGLTATALRYHLSRKSVWKWRSRWDGTWESLQDRSRRPHHSPRQQSRTEERLVKRYGKKYRDDLLLGYQKAQAYGYTRSYGCFKKSVQRLLGKPPKRKKKPGKPKPYQRADYPGQKLQLDVKFVPRYCVADGKAYYSLRQRMSAAGGPFGRCMMNTARTARGTSYINW